MISLLKTLFTILYVGVAALLFAPSTFAYDFGGFADSNGDVSDGPGVDSGDTPSGTGGYGLPSGFGGPADNQSVDASLAEMGYGTQVAGIQEVRPSDLRAFMEERERQRAIEERRDYINSLPATRSIEDMQKDFRDRNGPGSLDGIDRDFDDDQSSFDDGSFDVAMAMDDSHFCCFFGSVDNAFHSDGHYSLLTSTSDQNFLKRYIDLYKSSLIKDEVTNYAMNFVAVALGSRSTPTMYLNDAKLLIVSKRDLENYGIMALDQELIHAGLQIAVERGDLPVNLYNELKNLNLTRFSHLNGYLGTNQGLTQETNFGSEKAAVVGYQWAKLLVRKWNLLNPEILSTANKVIADVVGNIHLGYTPEGQDIRMLSTNLTNADKTDFIREFKRHTSPTQQLWKRVLSHFPKTTVQFDFYNLNRFEGTSFGDRIIGLNGDDLIYGREGNDRIYGGAGNDRLYGNQGRDEIHGNTGNDHIVGGYGDDTLKGNYGDDELHGQWGNDILSGGAGSDKLYGSVGNDQLYGNAGVDHLYGGSGNDFIVGGNDVDHIHGGDGDDKIIGEWRDIINTGSGRDHVTLPRISGRSMYIDGLRVEFTDRLVVAGRRAQSNQHCVLAPNGRDLICPKTNCSCQVCGEEKRVWRMSCSMGQGGFIERIKTCTTSGWKESTRVSCDGNISSGGEP